nr:Ras-related protein RABE1c [Tanacetum cinerariifolium]
MGYQHGVKKGNNPTRKIRIVHPESGRVPSFCVFLMVLLLLALSQPSALILRYELLNLMGSGLNSKFRTQLVRNASRQSQLLTTGELWDTAGQECFQTITTAYYRGAMGILLVHNVTNKSSFNNIRNWIHNIEQHASDNVNKILVGNKADMDESKRVVPTAKGQALADEYGIKFFETSANTNLNVEEVFFSIAKDIKQRLSDTNTKAEPSTIKINQPDALARNGQAAQKSACCGS